MSVDIDLFPTATVSMVDAHLPRDKGKRKAEFVPMQFVLKQNSQPRLKINLFSNKPPQDLSDSSAEETDEPMVSCSQCKTSVVLTEPKEKLLRTERPRQTPTTAAPSQKYMQEFHKKHSANDLYGLPKACQDILNLILTCPDAERIIQKVSDLGKKARFQHIHEAREHTLALAEEDQTDTIHAQDTSPESPEEEDGDPDGLFKIELATKEDKLKAALAELFPCSSSVNLHHLKSLYVTVHIEGYPVSKIFIDCGAIFNIIPVAIIKALRRSNDELIPSKVTMSSFVGDKS
ncbi:hypothetical protein D8674_013330 [Pyrus ussuriensis x Pyrus communis]|uniref:Aspartic peptidase DDI1-type domain-containing protein n=1 Tax=Pyrus ussuriensis x Pyrus communis TaxID=2448454 RepID=A0A5N5GU93_9ROSA|nr:hypothetical protein D8674_013330 [Pyrus ussuriensis x Pyrus communis]